MVEVAIGFPSDVFGSLLVEETGDRDVVEVHGSSDEERVEDARAGHFVGLCGELALYGEVQGR